jgi:hypothetical protein
MIRMTLARSLCFILWVLVLTPSRALAQEFEFTAPPAADDANTPALMRDLAGRVLPVYEEPDRDRYLENLSALQLVAGDYKAAYETRQSLRDRQRSADASRPIDRDVVFDLYVHARAMEAGGGTSFAQAFTQSFHEVVPPLNDRDAYSVTSWLATPLSSSRSALQRSFDQLRDKPSITLPEALDLIRAYLSFDAHRSFGPLVVALDREDDRRRYLTQENVLIKADGGAAIYARLVRPKKSAGKLSALLEFTVHTSQDDARASAAHGYAGVVAYTRGKKSIPGRIVPFEDDGEDARTVIGWIAKQPWSDGRVAMYGDGYSGFAAWAAAKRLPPELKAIATSDAMAPGIDFPMQGHIFRNSAYRWVTHNTQGIGDPGNDDDAQWRALDQAWYASGKSYRNLDSLAGKPNRIFRRWLNHPSYDLYWQKMIPFGEQFGRIDIPVLSTTGYYADGEAGALYYFTQHYRYKPDADHTLLVGPYDKSAARDEPLAVLGNYPVDPAALIDLREMRYQWFDHILKGGAKPALLKDRVNYEVMGANEWRHAPSLGAMANGVLRFYLDVKGTTDRHRLAKTSPSAASFLRQAINFADRSDVGGPLPVDLLGKSLPVRNGMTFVSEPLQQPIEVSGLLSGRLDFMANKMDMDLNVALYELLPGGDYLQMFDPYEFRASYVRDRMHRGLLAADKRHKLAFTSEQMTSRKLQAGSRVVLVLGINKRPDREINYGSGNDVSEESIEDAGIPMKIQWYGGSYIDVPVRR